MDKTMNSKKERLQKFMAQCGVASRRKSEELISRGKVKINGHPALIGATVDPYKDIVTVFGKRISKENELIYLMLYKPRGYLSTVSDDRGRKTVMNLVKNINSRIYPVGRLDRDSEGLLLMTNDGDFANSITHPSGEIKKTYQVTIKGFISDEIIKQMETGVIIDGKKTSKCQIDVLYERDDRTVLQFVLHEGRNREIRKMCEANNIEVLRLKRTAEGRLQLGNLKCGRYVILTEKERRLIFQNPV